MTRAHLLLVCSLSLAAAPARAYVTFPERINGRLVHARWDAAAMPLPFKMNNRPLEMLPNLSRSSLPQAATEAALRSWAVETVEMSFKGTVATTGAAYDQINLITFADTAANRDKVGNYLGVTLPWTVRQGNRVRIVEADVIISPQVKYSSDGSLEAHDLQSVITHELGHALGLDHSPIAAATMFPAGDRGQTSPRSLEPDDVAGVRALYGLDDDSAYGTISGKVMIDGSPLFGAHLVATDATGVVRAGALSSRDGSFQLTSLPPGQYRVYAEPLDEPMTRSDLISSYFSSIRRSFRTTLAGADAAAPIRVSAGQTVTLDPIMVPKDPPRLNIQQWWCSEDRNDWRYWPAPIRPGRAMYLLVIGPGLDTVPFHGFTVSGGGIQVDHDQSYRGDCNGVPCVVLTLWMGSGAYLGAHNLYAANDSERVALTGAIEVLRR